MEEKKKKSRPTWSMVRDLQSELNDLKAVCCKVDTLEKSNDLLEKESIRLRSENETLLERNLILTQELELVKNRGFWARVFNRL